MAKWGEGDPRWIVEERPDATNVNNWHWTEKNADNWSKKKLNELFTNQLIEDSEVGKVWVERVDKCEGEARVNNRKGKVILFYEWDIVLSWKGTVRGSSRVITGKIDIPNFSEEHEDMNDVDVECRLTYPDPEAQPLRFTIRKGRAGAEIRSLLGVYVVQLRTQYSTGVVLPRKGETEKKAPEDLMKEKTVASVDNTVIKKRTAKDVKKNETPKKKSKKRKGWKSNDLVFYVSLLSLVGISSVLVIKLARNL